MNSALRDKPGLALTSRAATIDFHVTSECDQECPYCWGPRGFEVPVSTDTALRIVERVKAIGAKRIVFTGGDPLKRPDIGPLISHAKEIGLEVALSTTGDQLTESFLREFGPDIDLISLPLDGPTEDVNARTKRPGHFSAIVRALGWLREQPGIAVKLCTPVTRHNLADVPGIVRLAEDYARSTRAQVFYNIFQAFPRAMAPVDWQKLLVSDEEFAALERQLAGRASIRLNFLSHATLDRLYVMIFPDGSLIVPNGPRYQNLGPFLEVEDLDAVLDASRFDSAKHLRHSRGWATAASSSSGPKG
jgi:MoaA/NifB/PqqE/SkfB family radical SAM enzyme